MLPTAVALHDIRDVEGFVCATIERNSKIRSSLSDAEHEELVGDGIAILYTLAQRFEPHRAGYATSGTFSGFAAAFLPKRLGDAWHARNPNHRRTTEADGTRSWTYDAAPVSLDVDDEPITILATSGLPGAGAEIEDSDLIRRAIATIEPWDRLGIQRMVALIVEEGLGWDEVGVRMDLDRSRVAAMRERLAQALAAATSNRRVDDLVPA